jgi:hypothetical protein
MSGRGGDSEATHNQRSTLKALVPNIHHAAHVLVVDPQETVRSLRMHTISRLLRELADHVDEVATSGTAEEIALLRAAWRYMRPA